MRKRTGLCSATVAVLAVLIITAANVHGVTRFSSGMEKNTLIELYTSQGCSSCPPAEKWLNGLKGDPGLWKDVVPVAFHVDYWDYLGWKDPYSSSLFSDMQRNLNRKGSISSVYTPCFVVNGKEWRGWFPVGAFPAAEGEGGALEGVLRSGKLDVSYKGKSSGISLHVAVLGFDLETNVRSGENRGRKLKEDFVVLSYGTYSSENGKWSLSLPDMTKAKTGRYGIAVWVTDGRDPVPVQATGAWIS